MINLLQPILRQKEHEVATLKNKLASFPDHPIAQLLKGKSVRTSRKQFANVLRADLLAVIAEIKRKSPSKGEIAAITDPVALASTYQQAGANALSILTDTSFFGGQHEDLSQVATTTALPILRKDFIIDETQIAEAITLGADAILCIVAITGNHTAKILAAAQSMNIAVLVEVHTMQELEVAINSGATVIGINNRDLRTFAINTEHALQLVEHIPADIIKVAESGILTPELARDYYRAGFNAVLIGEALVTAKSPQQFIAACRHA